MARKSKKTKPEVKAETPIVETVEETKPEVKAETKSKLFGKDIDRSSFALVEVELLKDHGIDKKGSVIKRHPNTADLLIERKIAKKSK